MDPKGVLDFANKHNAKILDLRFTDLPGLWQHVSYPIGELEESSFKAGFGFDGSSIRGWQSINESDMLLLPDPNTHKPYSRDPRQIALRAEAHLKESGVADQAYFGAEAEFFIFDSIRFDTAPQHSFFYIDSDEGRWNSGRPEHNLGYRPRFKEGYFPAPPIDHFQDLRTEMVMRMQEIGLDIECHHHEVATAGQCEIDQRFNTLVKSADNMMKYKFAIKSVAQQYGKTVTFMPKPLFGDNGSGMHTHQSLWNKNKPLFAGDKYAGLSQMALWYAGGLLKHGRSISAFSAPTTNSYKRLVPGYEAPVNLAYSSRNRSAAVRIPMYSASPKAKRLESRPPDPSCNVYLTFAAMLMAGLDGIENKIDPGKPLDKDIFELEADEAKKVPTMPGSLDEALKALADDHKYLTKGGVFTEELIEL